MTSEMTAIPLQLCNNEAFVLWLFNFFYFVHSKANLQYNIAITIRVSCVPDMLLASYCRTTALELCNAAFVCQNILFY